MDSSIQERYTQNSPVLQVAQYLETTLMDAPGMDVEGAAKVMAHHNQIVRDITGVDPHWMDV